MKKTVTRVFGLMIALLIIIGIPSTEAQAAVKKPVIKSTQVTIKKNTCSVSTGKKAKLIAKSGSKTVTKNANGSPVTQRLPQSVKLECLKQKKLELHILRQNIQEKHQKN